MCSILYTLLTNCTLATHTHRFILGHPADPDADVIHPIAKDRCDHAINLWKTKYPAYWVSFKLSGGWL